MKPKVYRALLILLALILSSTTLTRPQGNERIILVTTTDDAGTGSLREALQNARPGDHITFDAKVFPQDNPASIFVESQLPDLDTGGVIIDGSGAGVILNGSNLGIIGSTRAGFLDNIRLVTDTGENLIINSDFDESIDNWKLEQLDGVANYRWNGEEGAENNGSLELAPDPFNGTIYLTYSEAINKSNSISVGDAKSLNLSIWHQHLHISMMFDFIMADDGYYEDSSRGYSYSNTWLQEAFEIDVPEGARRIKFSFFIDPEYVSALRITSNNNSVQGLQIINFPGDAITLDNASNNQIGGSRENMTAPPCSFPCNLLSGNSESGIAINGGGGNIIQGNFIGTDINGLSSQGNGLNGIRIYSPNNIIGGQGGEGNLISSNPTNIEVDEDSAYNHILGNFIGVDISGEKPSAGDSQVGIAFAFSAHDNIIENNVISSHEIGIILGQGSYKNQIIDNAIGTDFSHTIPLGNNEGIFISEAYENEIGPGNYIAYNEDIGVSILSSNSLGNRISQNAITRNLNRGIQIEFSTENWIARPLDITATATKVFGYTQANTNVEIYTDRNNQGGRYLGTASADENGYFQWSIPVDAVLDEYITILAFDKDGTTSEFSPPVKVKKLLFRSLPGIVRPENISKDIKVIGVNVLLAMMTLIYVGVASTYFNEALEVYSNLLEEILFAPIKNFFIQISPWKKKEKKKSKYRILLIIIAWIFIVTLISVIQSFLDVNVLFSPEQGNLIGTLLLGGLIVGTLQTLGELIVRNRYKVKTKFQQAEVGGPGIILALISTGISYILRLNPGIVLGSVDTFFLKPDIGEGKEDEEKDRMDAVQAFVVKLIILGLTFLGWIFSAKLPNAIPLLEILFLVGLQYTFFELIPLDVLDGEVLYKKYPVLWGILFIPTLFGIYHLVFNPSSSDVQSIMQGNVGTLLWIMASITIGAILLRWSVSKIKPEAKIEITKAAKLSLIALIVAIAFSLLIQFGIIGMPKMVGLNETPTIIAPTEKIETTVIPTEPAIETEVDKGFTVLLDLTFDDAKDLNELEGYFSEGEVSQLSDENFIRDGSIRLVGETNLQDIILKREISMGEIIHIRTRVAPAGPCFFSALNMNRYMPEPGEKLLRFSSCPDNPYQFEAVHNMESGEENFNGIALDGKVEISANEWFDTLYWLNPDGESLFALAYLDGQFAYTTYEIDPEWQAEQVMFFIGTWPDPEKEEFLDIDFIRVSEGSLDEYLTEYFPEYFDALIKAEEEAEHLKILALEETAFQENTNKIYASMLQYEDLSERFSLTPIENKMLQRDDKLHFLKLFVQGPTRGGGGLWIINKLTIAEENYTDELMREELQIHFQDSIYDDATKVGDASIAFRRQPFDRYVFIKNNIMVDLYCNSVFTGYHYYCSAENMAKMAQNIYDRLPETLEMPEAIILPSTENGMKESPLVDFHIDINEGAQVEFYGDNPITVSVNDLSNLRATWFLTDWIPSLKLGLYWDEGARYLYTWEPTSISSLGVGGGRASIGIEDAGDLPRPLPAGTYTIRAFIEDRFVAETSFILVEDTSQ